MQDKKWFRYPRSSAFFTLAAALYLVHIVPTWGQAASNEIRAAVPRDFPPHYSINKTTRKPDGFAIDIMDEVAQRAGINVRYVVFDSWPAVFQAIQQKKADVIPNLGITADRQQWANFTVPVEAVPISLFVRQGTQGITGIESLSGRAVSVVRSNVGARIINEYEEIQPIIHESAHEALLSLLAGQSDALIYPKHVLNGLARDADVEHRIKAVGSPLLEVKRAIAVRKDKPELLTTLDYAAQSLLPTPTYQAIFTNWYGTPHPFWDVGKVVAVMGGLLLISIVVLAAWRYRSIVDLNRTLAATVAERRQMENALHEAHERNQAIVETALDAIITIDEHGLIESFSKMAEKMFGYSASEVIGENVSILMASPYREQHDAYLRRYRETGRKKIMGIGREVIARRRDGTDFPIHIAVGEMHLSGKRLFTGFLQDITDRKWAEEEARKRLDELAHMSRVHSMGQMASGLAHEINQPLSAIGSYAQACTLMLKSGSENADILRDSLEQIAQQTERAGDIVSRLRQFVSKGTTERARIDINGVVREVVELLTHEMNDHRIQLELDLDKQLPRVQIDKVQIEQVIVNLVRNAIDAMEVSTAGDRQLTVHTGARNPDGMIEVIVSDTGGGISQRAADRLFDAFFTTKSDGMGLGLAISRSIVESHQGRLWATANGDKGTTFRFTLPINDSGGSA